jgi:transposase
MTIDSNERTFVGIDVGADELFVIVRNSGQSAHALVFKNTSADHQKLVQKIRKMNECTVCLEATGVYSMDVAIALFDAEIRVMVINPQSSHNFAKVLGKHSKTDSVDGDTLAQYAERMPFVSWTRPTDETMQLRILSRRIRALTDQKAVAKNQSHALSFIASTPKVVLKDLQLAITQLENRIKTLSNAALKFIHAHDELEQPFQHLIGVTGIATTSAIALLGELLLLPAGLSHAQWVKFAGLDPKHFRSGTSVDKKARISKAGNHYIRAALYMPALSAKCHDPYVKAFFDHLIAMGKTPMQAVCAVMRKLLHALHGMLTNNQAFDNTRFYAIPNENNQVTA